MRVKFVDEAAAEFLDALAYYEQQEPKLGRRFKQEIEQTLHWLAENSEVCRLRSMVTADSIFESFLITFPTSIEDQRYGFWQLPTITVRLNTGFNGKTS